MQMPNEESVTATATKGDISILRALPPHALDQRPNNIGSSERPSCTGPARRGAVDGSLTLRMCTSGLSTLNAHFQDSILAAARCRAAFLSRRTQIPLQ